MTFKQLFTWTGLNYKEVGLAHPEYLDLANQPLHDCDITRSLLEQLEETGKDREAAKVRMAMGYKPLPVCEPIQLSIR